MALLRLFRGVRLASNARKESLEALCQRSQRAPHYICAVQPSPFREDDIEFDVDGGLSPCGIYSEKAGAARHYRRLPRAPAALMAVFQTQVVSGTFLYLVT